MTTYCDVNTCEDCPRYGDDCDGDKRVEHTDYISRADAIAYIDRVIKSGLGRYKSLNYIRKYISALPSAEAVQGEWIRHELFGNPWFTCSECNYHGRNDFNFCPNCGARMYKGGAE